MRKTYKKIIALCAVLIFALALIPVQSFAIGDPFTAVAIGGLSGASGAGLFGSMAGASGINIGWSSGGSDQMDAMWNVLNPDHVYFSGEKGQVTEPDPISGIPTVYDYIDVDIEDWLEAQSDFIINFAQTNNVEDNDSGTIVSDYQYNGTPLYISSGGNLYSDNFSETMLSTTVGDSSVIPFPDGYYVCTVTQFKPATGVISFTKDLYIGGQQVHTQNVGVLNTRLPVAVNYLTSSSGGSVSVQLGATYDHTVTPPYTIGVSYVIPNASATKSSNIPWTSSIVNTSVFDNWESARVKIPHSESQLSNDWTVSDFLNELDRIWTGAGEDNIIIEEGGDTPVPPVPIPSTPLGDIPTDDWYDLFGLPVLEGQEEIHQDLQDFSEQVQDGTDDIVGELEDIESDVESIDTNLGIGNGLLGDLKSIGQSIQSTLSSILSGVTDLVQEIVLSTETFIAGLLNSIMGGLGGWLSTMREAFSIWHYVVEWVGSISTVFSWFWSVAGSTSYYIQLPIYASLAGAVVLAFYKRFGK